MYRLKKSLGQHFLKDEGTAEKIVGALPREPGMQLLEVGPGGGALTRFLRDLPDVHFKALEIDVEKVSWLLQRYPDLQGKLIPLGIQKHPRGCYSEDTRIRA